MLNPSLCFWYLAQSWASSSICLSIYLQIYHDHHRHHQHLSIIYHLCIYYLSIIYHQSVIYLFFYQSFIIYVLSIEEVRCVSRLVVSDSATLWTVAHQAPLSMEFSRHEYWSGLPFPSPGDLHNPGIEPRSPILQADSLPSELSGKQQSQDSVQSSGRQTLPPLVLSPAHRAPVSGAQ